MDCSPAWTRGRDSRWLPKGEEDRWIWQIPTQTDEAKPGRLGKRNYEHSTVCCRAELGEKDNVYKMMEEGSAANCEGDEL